jgi:ligand-binding sensor domain-containing protein
VQLNHKSLAVLLIGAAGLIAGAYIIGKKQGTTAPAVPPAAQLPGGHPPAAAAAAGTKFAQFKVGNKNVKSIYADGQYVWVGTSGGAIKYDTLNDSFKLYDNTNGLLSNGIFYVGRIQGKLTVGTYGGGMSILDEAAGTWKTYNIPEGLGDAFVYEVMEAKNGDIWIATWSGANRIRGGALDDRSKWDLFTVENTQGGLPNDWVYGLAEGQNGDIWLATEGGMALFANNQWQNWNHATGIGAPYEKVKAAIEFKNDPGQASMHHAKQKQEMGLQDVSIAYNPNYIVSLEVTRDGKIWAGTWGGGLSVYDGKSWSTMTSVEGLPGDHVFMLHEDAQGVLWIGTSKGLAKRDPANGRLETLTTADGLFDNNVFSMATTPDGAMWVGSFGGVAFLKPQKP